MNSTVESIKKQHRGRGVTVPQPGTLYKVVLPKELSDKVILDAEAMNTIPEEIIIQCVRERFHADR